jgi:putative transcriptional regulator
MNEHRGQPFTRLPLKNVGGRGGASPHLLIASPYLQDPNFVKTVILMIEHHGEGALGMIVNRPTEMRVANAFRSPEIEWSGDPEEVIWFGGPVMRESCWILHEPVNHPNEGENQIRILEDLVISTSAHALRRLTLHPPGKVRFIRGLAGWGASQLEEEISSGLWLTADLQADFIFSFTHEEIWHAAYQRLGIDPAYFSFNQGIH